MITPTRMATLFGLPLLLVAGMSLAACGGGAEPGAPAAETPAMVEEPTVELIPTEAPTTEAMATDDVLAVLEKDGRFTTLLSLVATAGLTDALKVEGPLTLFAPTDDAFSKLPAGALDGLSTEALTAILMYHITGGALMSADAMMMDGSGLPMMGGEAYSATLKVDAGQLMINDATVTAPDLAASNGVIHAIDTVLMPPTSAEGESMDEAATPETGATAEVEPTATSTTY